MNSSTLSTPAAVRIVEVGPRDGLQNISSTIPTATKIELIRRLHTSGLNSIEITSVVSPKVIPQLADNQKVLSSDVVQSLLRKGNQLRLPTLIPNTKGLEIAIKHNVQEVAVFVSASEGFSKANTNCSVEEGLDRARKVADMARGNQIAVRGYISCIFSCPYDGPTPHSAVLRCVQQLLQMGCYEISLGDTVGVGVASNVRSLLKYLFSHGIAPHQLAGHFHDTYGQAVSNVWAAYQCGLTVFDSSVAGLGGCPYAPGAKGNVATEDLVYLFDQAGVQTGVDLTKLVETGMWISKQLERQNESRAGNALAVKNNVRLSPLGNNNSKLDSPKLQWSLIEDQEGLQIYRSGPNAKLVLNRPRNGNALTSSMIAKLTSFLEVTALDRTITRIAMVANGKHFCTGMDLSKGSTPVSQDDGGSASAAQFDRLTRLFEAIDKSPQVTISCLNGPAFGGGVGLFFASDIRLAVSKATVTLSEVKLGLTPATISKYVARELGPAFTREAMLSGRAIPASELYRLGFVARVVESKEQLEGLLDDYLNDLKACAPRASTLCKEIVKLSVTDAGGEKQAKGIRQVFEEMMGTEAEAAFGVKEFQSGRRTLDWDEMVRKKYGSKL